MMSISRCGWVKLSDPIYVSYHDDEWGKPLHDDRALFVWRRFIEQEGELV